jgi:hypothetical protein
VLDPILVPLAGIIFGIPGIALGARLVMKPILDYNARMREVKLQAAADPERQRARDERLLEMESELSALREEVQRLHAVEGFYQELQAPVPPASGTLPPPA